MKITNIAPGTRGFFYNGALVSLEPGETRDIDLNEKGEKAVKAMPESFKVGATKKEQAEAEAAAKAQLEQDEVLKAQATEKAAADEEAKKKAAAAKK